MLWQTIQSRKLRKLQVVTLVPFSHPASPPHTAPQGAEPPVSGSSLSSCCGTNRQSWETWGNSFRHKAKSQMMLMKKNRPGFLSTYFLTFSIKIIWKYKYINFKAVCVCVCVCVPVESYPVSFQSGCELRSSLLQRLHEILLDERSQLRRTLPGTDGLLQRHQTGHVPLLLTHKQTLSDILFQVNPLTEYRKHLI